MKRLWGRKVSDYAFAEFVTILRYVAETNGACVVKAGRWDPSTKKCHVCKTLVPPIPLDQRVWVCPSYGTTHDRDINAAINIRDLCFPRKAVS